MSGDPSLTLLPVSDGPLLEAARIVLATPGLPPVALIGGLAVTARVSAATPAGLVAAKSHAVGFPSRTRRATKHGSDLLDLIRLVDLYANGDALSVALRAGPVELARIIADVCDREILENPVRAALTIATVSQTPVDPDDVANLIGGFVDDLRR